MGDGTRLDAGQESRELRALVATYLTGTRTQRRFIQSETGGLWSSSPRSIVKVVRGRRLLDLIQGGTTSRLMQSGSRQFELAQGLVGFSSRRTAIVVDRQGDSPAGSRNSGGARSVPVPAGATRSRGSAEGPVSRLE